MRRPRGQEGLTLVELLLAITLLGVIGGPLLGAIFVILQNTAYTLDRPTSEGTAQDQLVTAHDEQALAAAFGADGQSSAAVVASRPACAAEIGGVAVVPVVGFTWPDSSGAEVNKVRVAWYYLARPLASDGVTPDLTQLATLRRSSCTADSTTPSTALPGTARDVAVSSAVGPVNPSITCDGTAPPCSATTKVVGLQVELGLDSSSTFGVQAQRRLV